MYFLFFPSPSFPTFFFFFALFFWCFLFLFSLYFPSWKAFFCTLFNMGEEGSWVPISSYSCTLWFQLVSQSWPKLINKVRKKEMETTMVGYVQIKSAVGSKTTCKAISQYVKVKSPRLKIVLLGSQDTNYGWVWANCIPLFAPNACSSTWTVCSCKLKTVT